MTGARRVGPWASPRGRICHLGGGDRPDLPRAVAAGRALCTPLLNPRVAGDVLASSDRPGKSWSQ